ncbi:MAG: Vi polysaccharide biosynthesis UDP-N-acetylglucosaminuronic acid epimerase TviC [Verrucomicrobiota bacterium]
MPAALATLEAQLRAQPRLWLVTGAAGFIGSHLLHRLLELGQAVRGFDNLATGSRRNLQAVQAAVAAEQWARFEFVEGDLRDLAACRRACAGVERVLHQAALGSVPLSLERPLLTHEVNVTGTLHVLEAAREAGVRRVVYASSSAVYGDDAHDTKVEDRIGQSLSPYAASKRMNEIHAGVHGRCYGLATVGLRYFNVYGPRQDPNGPYAAVIPRWAEALRGGAPVHIHGDGETSRDFCYVADVVQANLLAAMTSHPAALNQVCNVACGRRTSLNDLFRTLRELAGRMRPEVGALEPVHGEFRAGDIRHSLADLGRSREGLGYEPTHTLAQGLERTWAWYQERSGQGS